jgi:glycerophosphoryl diester phosphodiesterase
MWIMKTSKAVFFGLMLAVAGCTSSQKNSEPFDIQGHRGARGLAPENSIDGFIKALDLGVKTLEMDLVVTGDGVVVLSHEPYLSRTICATEGGLDEREYNIYKMTLEELHSYYCGVAPNPDFPEQLPAAHVKPALDRTIAAVKAYCDSLNRPLPNFNMEIKSKRSTDLIYHPGPAEFTAAVMEVVTQMGIEEQTIIQSFDPRPLRLIHGQYPSIRTAYLTAVRAEAENYRQKLGFRPTAVSPEYSMVDTALIGLCHRDSVSVIPWTVNELKSAQELFIWGVDGIITDYPDRINASTVTQ